MAMVCWCVVTTRGNHKSEKVENGHAPASPNGSEDEQLPK
jgi:hypothetical protein